MGLKRVFKKKLVEILKVFVRDAIRAQLPDEAAKLKYISLRDYGPITKNFRKGKK